MLKLIICLFWVSVPTEKVRVKKWMFKGGITISHANLEDDIYVTLIVDLLIAGKKNQAFVFEKLYRWVSEAIDVLEPDGVSTGLLENKEVGARLERVIRNIPISWYSSVNFVAKSYNSWHS